MTTQYSPSPAPSRRPAMMVIAGCAVAALCLGLVGVGGAGWWFYNRRARAGGEGQPAVEYILDASPRMAEPTEGGSRLSVAQGVLAEIVRPANPEVTAALRVFGSGRLPEACKDTELVVPLAPSNQARISDQLVELQAGLSADAALAEAMIAAIRDLRSMAGPHTLVVVTGGADSCNPEAGQLIAQEAERSGISLQMFVVGYQLSAEDAEALRGLVDEAGGTYLEAVDEATLIAILEAIQAYIDDPSTPLTGLVGTAVVESGATGSGGTGTGGTGTGSGPEATEAAAATEAAGGSGGSGGTDTGGGTGTGGTDGYAAQTACDHPYFPLRAGATWTYSTEYGPYTWTVTGVTGDLSSATATVEMVMEGTTFTFHWNCTAEGVVSYEFGNMAVAGVDMPDIEVVSSEGAWLLPPGELEVGSSWDNNYTIQYAVAAEGFSMDFTMSGSQSFTAIGMESVSVPAGSFEALRVDNAATFETTSSATPATSFSSTGSYWYAYGVGMVQTTSSSEGASSTAQLVSYSIP